ncbi:20941_t:CDS:2, partial [Racocetra persica]
AHVKEFISDENSKFSFPKEHGHSDEDAERYQEIAEKAHKHLTSTGEHEAEIDHESIRDKHKKIYESDNVTEHSDEELGHAAAFEALKKMCSGESYDKSALLSLAMSEGMKLWKKKQAAGDGDGGGQEEILG